MKAIPVADPVPEYVFVGTAVPGPGPGLTVRLAPEAPQKTAKILVRFVARDGFNSKIISVPATEEEAREQQRKLAEYANSQPPAGDCPLCGAPMTTATRIWLPDDRIVCIKCLVANPHML